MGEQRRQPMVMPAGVLAPFLMGHAQCRFRFLEALCDGPPHPTEPHEQAPWRARRRIAEGIPLRRFCPQGALEHQPHVPVGESVRAARHPCAGKRLRDRAFGAFRARPAIPARGREALRQGLHRDRGLCLCGHQTFAAYLSAVWRGFFRRQRSLEPTTGRGGQRHQRRHAATALDGVQAVWTRPIEAIGHTIRARESPLAPDRLLHLHGSLRLGVQGHVIGHVARGTAGCIVLRKPLLRHEEPRLHQRIAMPRGLGGTPPHLTMLSLPYRATILSCHAHRLLALCDKARLIEHAHALRVPQLGCDEAMGRLAHQVFIPHIIAPAALHPPDIAPGHTQGHRCDGCAFQRTALANHGMEQVLACLTACKTRAELGMECLECIKESLHITDGEIKRRDGALLALRATCW